MSGWKIFGIIFGALTIIGFLIWAITGCLKEHKRKKVRKAYETLGANQVDDAEILEQDQ